MLKPLVLAACISVYFALSSRSAIADAYEDSMKILNVVIESPYIPPAVRRVFNWGATIYSMNKEIQAPAYANDPHVVLGRGATGLVVGSVVYPIAYGAIAASCAVNSTACAVASEKAIDLSDSIVEGAKDKTEDGIRAFDAAGYAAAKRVQEARANGYQTIDDWPPIRDAHTESANILKRVMKALGVEPIDIVRENSEYAPKTDAPSLSEGELAELVGMADTNGAGLSPKVRDDPFLCVKGHPYWKGGCFDPDRPPQADLASQQGQTPEQFLQRYYGQQQQPNYFPAQPSKPRCGPGMNAPDFATPNPRSCF